MDETNENIGQNDKNKMLIPLTEPNGTDNPTSIASTRLHPWYKLEVWLLPCKTVYILIISKEVIFRMNLILFCLSIGLTKTQAGLISGLRLIGVVIGAPFWGLFVDKYKKHRLVIVSITTVALVCTVSQLLVAYYLGDSTLNKCRMRSSDNIKFKAGNLMFNNSVSASNESFDMLNNMTQVPKNTRSSVSFTKHDQFILFGVLFIINFIQAFFDGGLEPFIDYGVMARLKIQNEELGHHYHTFGRQRFWGVLGEGFAPVLGNVAIDYFPSGNMTCYTGAYVVYFIVSLLYSTNLFVMFTRITFSNDDATNEQTGNILKLFLKTLFTSKVILYYTLLFIIGILIMQGIVFLFPLMTELGSSMTERNIAVIISSVSSAIGFIFIHKIIRAVGGDWNGLVLALLMYFFRFLGMGLTTNMFIIIALQAFQVVGSTVTEHVSVHFVQDHIPVEIHGAMFGFVNAIQFSLSDVVGSSVGGIIYDNLGISMLFVLSSILAIIFAFLCFIYNFVTQRRHFRREKESTNIFQNEMHSMSGIEEQA